MTEIWQQQAIDTVTLSLDDIHRLAAKVESTVSHRNRYGLLICAAEVFAFGGMWLAFPGTLQRFGCTWTLAGLLFMSAQLLSRPASRPAAHLGMDACLAFQREEVVRQRDFHRGIMFWSRYLAFVPGPLIFGLGFARTRPEEAIGVILTVLVYAGFAVCAIPLNMRLARVYQRSIDALDRSAR